MSPDHGRTRHPEWYSHAPVTHPAIGQNSFHCHRCGNLVVELPEHDAFHEGIDDLIASLKPALTDATITKITEPKESSSVARVSELKPAQPRKTPATKRDSSSSSAPSGSPSPA